MKPPDSRALQVFYGSIPVLLAIVGFYIAVAIKGSRDTLLLRDILARLGGIESEIKAIHRDMGNLVQRVVRLEERAGIVYKP